jgi:uroporphyrinogen-III synthase
LIAQQCDARAGAIIHVAGRERAGDLTGALAAAGFTARHVVMYAADAATTLSDDTRAQLAEGVIDDVMIFSPRTARQFVTLVRAAGLEGAARRLRLLALSKRVAEASAGLEFAAVLVAARPGQDGMLALLGDAPSGDAPSGDD